MVQNDSYYKHLVLGFINNSISAVQVKELQVFIQREPEKYALLMDEPEVVFLIKQQMEGNSLEIQSEVDQRFQTRIKEAVELAKPVTRRKPLLVRMTTRWRWAAAAVFIIAIGTVAIVLSVNNDNRDIEIVTTTSNKSQQMDVLPGRSGAILTLADGTKVLLDSLGDGIVATQGKTNVLIRNNELVYDASAKQREVLYNTMTTPKGRQYLLVLPDGSRVWLNAASSINYPTVFAANDRSVTLTGEAYFEVAKDASKKFVVNANGVTTEVLGTHFNINAYEDEKETRITLLEGSVKVKQNASNVILKPGQQAITKNTDLSVNNNPDLEVVMAWKKGIFLLDNTDLPTIMRQISRWYDVDVVYQGKIDERKFGGGVSKNLPLSKVLELLEANGIKFKKEGRRIILP